MKRIVLKLGTQVVSNDDGSLRTEVIRSLATSARALIGKGYQPIVVSSGAVGLGRQILGLSGELSLVEKQACASAGQGDLIHAYKSEFNKNKVKVAQLLVTAKDFSQRATFLNLKNTIEELLKKGVVPILNENDVVSVQELETGSKRGSFSDNDRLAAIVSGKLGAKLLILLTNVEGIFEEDPKTNSNSKVIREIRGLEELNQVKLHSVSSNGRGGMRSKVESALLASMSGVTTFIGPKESLLSIFDIVERLEAQSLPEVGSVVWPSGHLKGKKHWIGSSGFEGVVFVNEGAKLALTSKRSSLLAAGITGVEGTFEPSDIVSIQGEDDEEIGRGQVAFSSDQLSKILGKQSSEIKSLLGEQCPDEVIHRDRLVVFQDYRLGPEKEQ